MKTEEELIKEALNISLDMYVDDKMFSIGKSGLKDLARLAQNDGLSSKLCVVSGAQKPNWLDNKTIDIAVDTWNSHKETDDGLRLAAINIIRNRAIEEGTMITIQGARDIIDRFCLK